MSARSRFTRPHPWSSKRNPRLGHLLIRRRFGIYRLPAGSRVVDAVVAAGGAVGADLDQLNLAAKLQDGTEVLVPARGNGNPNLVKQVGPSSEYESTPTRNNRGQKDRGQKTTTPIDLNTASIEELESVPGVGKTTAQRILDYRNQHERFQSIDELTSVGGIGAKKLERIRKWLHL
jgi:competence protein ComEA